MKPDSVGSKRPIIAVTRLRPSPRLVPCRLRDHPSRRPGLRAKAKPPLPDQELGPSTFATLPRTFEAPSPRTCARQHYARIIEPGTVEDSRPPSRHCPKTHAANPPAQTFALAPHSAPAPPT